MKSEKRKPRSLLGMLAADPYRKLAAVALAVGLWFYLNSQITKTVPYQMQLATIGTQETGSAPFNRRIAVMLPTDRVVAKQFYDGDKKIEYVTAKFSGQTFRIDALENEPLDLRISNFVGMDWSKPTSSIELSAADVQRNLRSLQDVEITFDPPRIRLEVERIDPRPERLQLGDVEILGLDPAIEQRLRKDTAKFSPEVVNIVGSASNLAKFPATGSSPFRARFSAVGNARGEISTLLELNAPPELGLSLQPKPSLTIQLMPVTQFFNLELPVIVDDLSLAPSQRGYQPENPTETVRVRAGGTLMAQLVSLQSSEETLREWVKNYLRLEVWIEPPTGGASYLPEIQREPRLRLRGQLQATADPGDYALDPVVLIRLHRKP